MHSETVKKWQHQHSYFVHRAENERNTLLVMILTAITMVAEIFAGSIFGSMALLADGWHMGTHVAAFLITLFAYRYSRRHRDNPAFSFGTGKINILGGFTSAVALGMVALMMVVESCSRFFAPVDIHYRQSILVAAVGLGVNIISAMILHEKHPHGHHHNDEHGKDHNLLAAYFHVLADALTSLLAIGALLLGAAFGWWMLDPLMGIVGALVIGFWAWGLVRRSAPVLLDAAVDQQLRQKIRAKVEAVGDNQVSDLHVWKIGPQQLAAVVSLVTHRPRPLDEYHRLLSDIDRLEHLTFEVISCRDGCCHPDRETIA